MGNVRMRAEQINYGASNVKAALDDLDPMALIAFNKRMSTIEAWKATVKTEEKTGAEVTFTNALALNAVSVSAEIEVEQDLHGYDHPWVGGAGKNKYKMTTQTQTQDTITVTANDDGTVNISRTGATTQNVAISLLGNQSEIAALIAAGGTYTLTSNKGAYDVYAFNVTISYKNSASATTNEYMKIGDTVTFPVGAVFIASNLYVNNGRTVNAYDNFALQLESGSSATSFAPYSNECPISGHTSVTITDYDSDSNTATVTIQLGQTVYGGTLNVTTGVMTVTHELITLDGSSDETWAKSSITACDIFRYANTDYKFVSSTLTNMYPFVNEYDYNQIGYTWKSVYSGVTDAELRIGFSEYNTTTLEQFKTWLASNNLQVYAQLATPQTIQLTPTDLQMLKGYNRLSADTGDITVEAYTGAAWGGDEA